MRLLITLLLLLPSLASADLQKLVSPGPLAEGHKALDSRCESCHVPWKGIPSSACLTCHTATAKRIQANLGTHAKFEREGKKCSSCHGDHKGRNHVMSPPVPSAAFAGAAHKEQTGVALDGKHASAACASCHKPGKQGPRWSGLPTTCIGCHTDVHKGSFGTGCDRCHAPTGWKPTTRTVANHLLPMTGKHEGLACASCHQGGKHLTATRSSCGDCHAQQHGGTKAPCETCHNTKDWKTATFAHDFCTCILPGKHQTATCLACHPAFKFTPTPFACAGCHKKERPHEELGACSQCHSVLSWKTKAFDHNKPKVGFKIEGKHTEVGCENCHKEKGIFRTAPKTCAGCHAVAGKLPKHGDFGACAKCHTVAGWNKPSFDHAKTAFPLDGNHQKASCQACHATMKKGQFQPGPNACRLCHSDPHKGQFGALTMPIQLAGPPAHVVSTKLGCMDCHTPNAWKPSTVTPERHADLGYPLRGGHAGVACASCHDGGQFLGTPKDCKSCHFDRHRGKVGNDCARCHDERGWKWHAAFDHKAETGMTLDGAHGKIACAQCHGTNHEKFASLITQGPIACATCHTPKHGDQFGTTCTKCHSTTRWSDVPRFDHSRTMFPLERKHAALPCVACHDTQKLQNAGKLDPSCRTCHGDPHRGRTQSECGDCHRADRWSIVRFDHDRTFFPLRGKHFATPCRDCHVNDQFTGVRYECVSCHRADRQRAEAEHPDHRAFSPDCADCHKPFKW